MLGWPYQVSQNGQTNILIDFWMTKRNWKQSPMDVEIQTEVITWCDCVCDDDGVDGCDDYDGAVVLDQCRGSERPLFVGLFSLSVVRCVARRQVVTVIHHDIRLEYSLDCSWLTVADDGFVLFVRIQEARSPSLAFFWG